MKLYTGTSIKTKGMEVNFSNGLGIKTKNIKTDLSFIEHEVKLKIELISPNVQSS